MATTPRGALGWEDATALINQNNGMDAARKAFTLGGSAGRWNGQGDFLDWLVKNNGMEQWRTYKSSYARRYAGGGVTPPPAGTTKPPSVGPTQPPSVGPTQPQPAPKLSDWETATQAIQNAGLIGSAQLAFGGSDPNAAWNPEAHSFVDWVNQDPARLEAWRKYKVTYAANGMMAPEGKTSAPKGGLLGGSGTGSNDGSTGGGVQGGLQGGGVQAGSMGANGYGYNPATYKAMTGLAAQMAAQGLRVTPDMLVNEQLANMMKSPVGQMAMDIARQQMNARGMMDSTSAQNAIVQAAIQAGLPIAKDDAATYFNAAQETMAAENASKEANMNAANNMTVANMGAVNTANAGTADAYNNAFRFNTEQAEDVRRFNLDKQFKQQTQEMEDYWKRIDFAEGQRQFNAGQDLNMFNAETNRIASAAQADYQNANTESAKRAVALQATYDVWESGLTANAARDFATVMVSQGVFTIEEAATLIEHYTEPTIETT
jgi:hypothetical protein